MLRGFTRFKCDDCGKKFIGLDIEWNASFCTDPAQCPQCGGYHTYVIGIFNLFGKSKPSSTDRMIWKKKDNENNENK